MLHLLWTVGSTVIILIGLTLDIMFWVIVGVLLLGVGIIATVTE